MYKATCDRTTRFYSNLDENHIHCHILEQLSVMVGPAGSRSANALASMVDVTMGSKSMQSLQT